MFLSQPQLHAGAELKQMFLESGGNFDLVEIKVKKWVTDRATKEETNSRVTKRMLKEKYFWDEPATKFPYMHDMTCFIFFRMRFLLHMIHMCMHGGELSSMIENTWKWAAEHNRIIKHPISGGEFVDVDVESLSKRIHEEGSNLSQQTGGVYKALNGSDIHSMHACMHV